MKNKTKLLYDWCSKQDISERIVMEVYFMLDEYDCEQLNKRAIKEVFVMEYVWEVIHSPYVIIPGQVKLKLSRKL